MSGIVLLPGEGKSVRMPPSDADVVLKLRGADTGRQFALIEIRIEPGTFVPPHRHPTADEFNYVLDGELTVLVGERVIQAPAGTVISKPRGIFHAFWNSGSKPARFLEIISPAGLEKNFEEAADLAAAGASPGQLMAAWAQKAGEIDMSRVPELVRKYNLKFPGVPGHTMS